MNLKRSAVLVMIALICASCGGSSTTSDGSGTIKSTIPVNNAVDVGFDQTVEITFSDSTEDSLVSDLKIIVEPKYGGPAVLGSTAYDAATKTLIFTPRFPLTAETEYVAQIPDLEAAAMVVKAADTPLVPATNFTTLVRPVIYRSTYNESDPSTPTNWNVWTMNSDGSGKTRLTDNTGNVESSWQFFGNSWAPGYDYIAYQTVDDDNGAARDLWISNADGSSPINVTGGVSAMRVEEVVWAPDGTKIYYTYGAVSAGNYNLYVSTVEGTVTQLTNYTGNDSINEQLRISEDGTRLFYRKRDKSTDRNVLYVMELDSPSYDTHALTSLAADESVFQISYVSNLNSVLFIIAQTGSAADPQLYGLTLNEARTAAMSSPVLLADHGAGWEIKRYSVSPLGDQVAYATLDTGASEIHLYKADLIDPLSALTPIEFAPTVLEIGWYLNWSPDASKIAYEIGNELIIADVSGAPPVDLEDAIENITGFSGFYTYDNGLWSTDSKYYMYFYHEDITTQHTIAIVEVDTGTIVDLTDTVTDNAILIDWWQPVFELLET